MSRTIAVCLGLALSAPGAVPAIESGVTLTGGASVVARQQDLLVSKGVGGINFSQAMATNPNTGDVLVVWTHRDSASDGTRAVWGALLTRKGSGKYKNARPRKLSSGAGEHYSASAKWIEANKEFFVVWEQRGFAASSRVLGVAVNAKTGKAARDVKTLVSDNIHNQAPVFVADFVGPGTGSRTTGARDAGQLLWLSFPVFGAGGLELASLSEAYKLRDRQTLLQSRSIFHGEAAQLSVVSTRNRLRTLAPLEGREISRCSVTLHQEGSPTDTKTVVILWRDGEEVDRVDLRGKGMEGGSGANARLYHLRTPSSEGTVHFAGAVAGSARLSSVNITPCRKLRRGVRLGSSTDPIVAAAWLLIGPQQQLSLDRARATRNRQSQESPIGHLIVAEDDGQVYREAVNAEGGFEDREAVFEHDNKLISMIGDRIPWVSSSGRKANAMVLWTKSVGRKAKLELRAQFFYLKPLR